MATLYYRPATTEPNGDELPTHDAIENLLPKYQYIVKGDDAPGHLHPRNLDDPSENTMSPRPEDVERVSMSLLDYQQQELEKYRTAVHTMGKDIVELTEKVRRLETQNSTLRGDLDHYNDSTRLLLDAQELDGLSRADLADRYVALKHNLNRQSGELRDYKDKVLRLQNELIKKNDREKDYGRLSDAHEGQQAVVQRLQERSAKVRRLEEVIRKQEKVIEKMEKVISKRSRSSTKDTQLGIEDSVKDALMDENKRLRSELEHTTGLAGEATKDAADQDQERLNLYTRLERTEARIVSLEKQLSDNARQWARERSDMMLQIQENDAGILRGSPLRNSRVSPILTVPKPRARVKEAPIGEPRHFSRYSHEPRRERHKPHIGYNTPLYDPITHS